MKFTFLGSSHGVPAADRYCSSLMIEVGEKTYIIDAGAPLIDCLLDYGKTPTDVEAIFITHAHGDHINGLIGLVDLVDWYYKNDSFDVYVPEQSMIDGIVAYHKLALHRGGVTERVRFTVATPDFVYDDGNLKVTYIPTKHINGGVRPSYAMLLEADGKTVLVTGDLSQQLRGNDFPSVAYERETDAIVCEMAHFGKTALTPILPTLKTKQMWMTHVWPLRRFDDVRAMENEYPYPIHLANDGDVFLV